jgi:hypothetical protein
MFKLALLALSLLATTSALAAQVTVEVTNATHGIYFTPLLVTAHDASTHLFEPGQTASANLQAMAEGGDITGLLTDLGGEDDDTVVNPAVGLLAPGVGTTAVLDTTASGNTHLSLVAMLLPTNDGFVGVDAVELPTAPGTYVYPLVGYDAGTEANDEQITGGGAPGVAGIPAAPGGDGGTDGSGVAAADTNGTVHVHRGTLGDTNPSGGASDLDSRIHRWLNPVALLRLTVQ